MVLRAQQLTRLAEVDHDVLVIGGGINGAVSAAALAGRGAKVALIDKRDFAGFTSQQSSNLAWGGIKYMESYEYKLVRELCKSRNHLIQNYPSVVQEIRFFTTIRRGFRWHPLLLWMGTWLYWLIGSCFTQIPRLLSRKDIQAEEPSINLDQVIGGFEYSDAFLYDNDARFVFRFIRSAMDAGCVAANYVESLGSRRENGFWITRVREGLTGREFEIRSRVLINAAGPFVDEHNQLSSQHTQHHHVYSKGIHLIVDQITPSRRVLAFFADDGRLFFVIPMGAKTCIGTTDTRVEDPITEVTPEDRRFVLDNINKCLKLERPLTEGDIIAERWGVRPLAIEKTSENTRDFLQLSRKHAVDVSENDKHISIFGGKLTDCINVGEEICEFVQALGVTLPEPTRKWYGEAPDGVKADYLRRVREIDLDSYTPETSSEQLSSRLWRRYGAEAIQLVEAIRQDPRQAELLIEGTEYLRCEIRQAAEREMIVKLEDFLRRRSKISLVTRRDTIRNAPGLREACEILFGDEAEARLAEYFHEQPPVGVMAPQAEAEAACSEALNW